MGLGPDEAASGDGPPDGGDERPWILAKDVPDGLLRLEEHGREIGMGTGPPENEEPAPVFHYGPDGIRIPPDVVIV